MLQRIYSYKRKKKEDPARFRRKPAEFCEQGRSERPAGESGIRFPYICPYLKSIRQDCGKRI